MVRAPTGDISNCVNWRRDESSPTYVGGSGAESVNSGTDWSLVTTDDYMFEDWGEPLVEEGESKSAGMAAKMIAGKLI